MDEKYNKEFELEAMVLTDQVGGIQGYPASL
jgi:hypothetical protein